MKAIPRITCIVCAFVATVTGVVSAQAADEKAIEEIRALTERIPFLYFGNISRNLPPAPFEGIFTEEELRAEAQYRLLAHTLDDDTLKILLDDPDPKVRTLALGAWFLQGRHHELPSILRFVDDAALTFPRTPLSLSAGLDPELMNDPKKHRSKLEFPEQTVGDWARSILLAYTYRSAPLHLSFSTAHAGTDFDSQDFARYWELRKHRDFCLNWLVLDFLKIVPMDSLSLQKPSDYRQAQLLQRQESLATLRGFLNSQPEATSPWLYLALTGAEHYVTSPSVDKWALLSAADLADKMQTVEPSVVMDFLRRQSPLDDPDLKADLRERARYFGWMAKFILDHAELWFDAEQADALLKLEAENFAMTMNPTGFRSSRWAAAASHLVHQAGDADRSLKILADAVERFSASEYSHILEQRWWLAKIAWELHGDAAWELVSAWFFDTDPKRQTTHGRYRFIKNLFEVPANRPLLRKILTDERLESTGWYSLWQLAKALNANTGQALFSIEELEEARYPLMRRDFSLESGKHVDDYPEETEALKAVLAKWRIKLRTLAQRELSSLPSE